MLQAGTRAAALHAALHYSEAGKPSTEAALDALRSICAPTAVLAVLGVAISLLAQLYVGSRERNWERVEQLISFHVQTRAENCSSIAAGAVGYAAPPDCAESPVVDAAPTSSGWRCRRAGRRGRRRQRGAAAGRGRAAAAGGGGAVRRGLGRGGGTGSNASSARCCGC